MTIISADIAVMAVSRNKYIVVDDNTGGEYFQADSLVTPRSIHIHVATPRLGRLEH